MIDPRPWFRLDLDAVLHDERVEMLDSFEQLGMLFFLACREWRYGPLLDSDERVERICRGLRLDFQAAWPRVRACFDKTNDGRLVLPWLEAERERADQLRATRSKSGARAHKRSSSNCSANGGISSASASNVAVLQGDVDVDVDVDGTKTKKRASASPPRAEKEERASSARKEFKDFWCDAFQRAKGVTYTFAGGKDGKLLKAILAKAGGDVELAKARARALLNSTDAFFTQKGVDLGTLASQWNKLASARPGRATESAPSGPAYQRFMPPDPEGP
jgi:hypothetical protein